MTDLGLNIALFQQNIVWENPEANFDKVAKAFDDYKGLPMSEIPPSLDATRPGERIIAATLSAPALAIFRQHWPFNLDFDGFEVRS